MDRAESDELETKAVSELSERIAIEESSSSSSALSSKSIITLITMIIMIEFVD